MTIQQQQSEELAEQPQTKPSGEGAEQERWPLIEIFTESGKLVLTADLPGMAAEDIRVRISEQEIRLTGERRRATEGREDRRYFEQERRYGRFERVIELPARVRPQTLKAHIENGLITLEAELAGD